MSAPAVEFPGVSAPTWSGAVTSTAISESPLTAVALVDGDGTIRRATALFLDCCGATDAFLAAHQTEIDTVLGEDVDQASATLGWTTLDVSAVTDSDGARCALLTIARPAADASGNGAAPPLDGAISASPAIVWLKDLGGRYQRINDEYVTALETPRERVCGKTDDELSPGESIEGLRLRLGNKASKEPLELEYTVSAHETRPAFAVLRFALRDAQAEPTAVCGVAAPLARADLARSECARLMRLERWSRSDELEIRAALFAEWGLVMADEPDDVPYERPITEPQAAEGETDQFAAMAAELDAALETSARLDQELAEERRQVMVLREASVLSSRRAQDMFRSVTAERARRVELEESLSRAEARANELGRERDGERARAERAEATTADALAQEHEIAETLRAELAATQDELERLHNAAKEAPTFEQLDAERAGAHEAKLTAEQAQAEATSTAAALARERRTVETLRAELRVAEEEVGRARRAASEAVAQAPTHDELEQERRRADRANAALAAARARTELAEAESKSALAQARAELRRTHEDASAVSEALNVEKQRGAALRGELAELRDELDHANRALAERPDAATADSPAVVKAERQAVERLRRELSGLRRELEAARQAVAERPSADELEQERSRAERAEAALNEQRVRAEKAAAVSTAAKTKRAATVAATADADRAAVEALRAELSATRAELERLQREASAEEISGSGAEPEPVAAEQAEPGSPVWNAASQRALSAELTAVEDWRGALKHAVKVIGSEGNWDAVVAWSPEQRRVTMRCAAMWARDASSSSAFETQVWQHRQKVPGEAAGHSPQPVLALESTKDALLKAAAAEGMGSAVLVPISDGTQLIGMLHLLSRQSTPPSAELMLSLEAIALQLAGVAGLLSAAGAPHWRLGRL